MQEFLKSFRSVCFLGTLGLMGLGLLAGLGGDPDAAHAQTKATARIDVSPPPADVNNLSMEVAALRTLYLLKTGPDLTEHRGGFAGVTLLSKDCAAKPRQRQEAIVSKNYRKVLTDLRAAFIASREQRINELSDQLEELSLDEPRNSTMRSRSPIRPGRMHPGSSRVITMPIELQCISPPTARISPTPIT
jgi:hypothetical protein